MRVICQKTILFGLLLSLLLPTGPILGQADANPDDIDMQQLYFEIYTERSLAGVKGSSALRDVRDNYAQRLNKLISDSETRFLNNPSDQYDIQDLTRDAKDIRDLILRYMDARIQQIEANEQNMDGNTLGMAHKVITDGAAAVDPSASHSPNPSVSNFQAVHADQRNQNAAYTLDGQVVEKLPEISAVVQSSSANVYVFDAGMPSSSTAVITLDDSTPVPSPEPTQTTVILPPTPAPITAPTTGGSALTLEKPLRFANNGSYAATVVVGSYMPAPGVTAGQSNASTVVFPGGNPSAQLSLPLGEYVFCYYWDLGTDADNDGYVDYAHRNTGKVTLSQTAPDRPESAQVVMLSPENASAPNGKCGQNQAPTQPAAASGLTPQEQANQGTHTYTCGPFAGEYTHPSVTFTFDKDSVVMTISGDEGSFVGTRIEPNVYVLDDKQDLIFTDSGFSNSSFLQGGVSQLCTRE